MNIIGLVKYKKVVFKLFDFLLKQVRVQRVVVDGLTRTKDDTIIKEIKPLLGAKTFDEVCANSNNTYI